MQCQMLATIGYEKSTQEDFVATLLAHDVDVLIDIRERAQSRKSGFSKTALSEASRAAGIEYLHFRELGDPKAGRDAARAGKIERFIEIFSEVLESESAIQALASIEELARSKRICLMCYEVDHTLCHRKLVSDILQVSLGCEAIHLRVYDCVSNGRQRGRMLHSRQGTTAQV